MADLASGGNPASMNATLSPQPRRSGKAPGASGRDAGEGAGLESGLYEKQGFGAGAGSEQLGKPLPGFGTPPWDDPPVRSAPGPKVTDTFGAGETHKIKNG